MPALTWAVAQPPLLTYAVLASAGLGMASPYLLIGAFPELIRFLPKPGVWMDTFKQFMGFVLLGTVVFIFTFLELPLLAPTIGLLFGLWAACWWIGRISPLASSAARTLGWIEAVAFAGVVWIFMFPGLGPLIGSKSFAGSLADVMQDRFERQVYVQAAILTEDQQSQRPERLGPQTVMVDFTADWCLSCKNLERTVLSTAPILDAVKKNDVVTLQADWSNAAPEVTRLLSALIGKPHVPVLAIFPAGDPNRPIVIEGLDPAFRTDQSQQVVLDALAKAGASK